jgi:branched-chain amino acid transport system substrate-binding protein
MAALRKAKFNDMYQKNGYLRADGRMVHDMYLMQVKAQAESKYPWDYYKLVQTIPASRRGPPRPNPSARLEVSRIELRIA